jgi:vancomycin resistance protein VanW
VDQRLQINKVTNLRLAAAKFDGQVIRPGKTFSFWHCLGRPTERRGYLTGLLLADGAACEGTGGGLCQMANLLYWLALHSPLTVTERHHHSLDVFPDSGRVLPFGSGASVFYNYVDLQFRNDTKLTLRFRVKVDEEHLHGELWTDELSELSYHVQERDHRFYQDESGTWWRENRLYQIAVDRTSGNTIDEKLIVHNVSKVLYLR